MATTKATKEANSSSSIELLQSAIGSVLGDIADLAATTDRQCYFTHSHLNDPHATHEELLLEVQRLRGVVRTLGCMADIAMMRTGWGGGAVLTSAEDWLFSPLASESLGKVTAATAA